MAVTLISNESVIGTLTPNVYVNSITLENTGKTNLNDKNSSLISIHTAYTEKLKDVPPGIDGLPVMAQNLQIQSQAALEDIYTNPASTVYSDSKLKVKIDMVLKESTGGLAEFWANKPNENAYVKIASAFTTDSLATKILSVGSNMLRKANSSSADNRAIALSVNTLLKLNMLNDAEKQVLTGLGVSDTSFKAPFTLQLRLPGDSDLWWDTYIANVMSFLENNIKDISIKSMADVMGNNSIYGATTIPYFETDAGGNTLKNYKFSHEYVHNINNPKHLSFAVMSYLDLKTMTEDFDIDFNMVKTPHGKLVYEQIIDNFNINTKSFLYINPIDNNIWAGPVHAMYKSAQGKELDVGMQHWKTGFKETADSFTVVKKAVTNTKIQDFRAVERVEKLNFDLSFLETQIFNRGMSTKHITSDKMDVIKQPAYFTPLHLARDQSGNCRFMFGVDYYTLLVENTLFGKLWQPFTPFQLGDLKQNTKLINFKVKRRRVNNIRGTTSLGGSSMVEEPFKTGYLGEPHIDDEEIIETVASGRDEFSDAPFKSTYNFKENQIAFPVTGYNNFSYGLRFFSGADVGMSAITDGSYQYGVELEIIDNTVIYILRQIRTLYDYYQTLCTYYEDATTPASYDYRSNRFRRGFESKWTSTSDVILTVNKTDIKISSKPWEKAISALLETVNRFRPPEQPIPDSTSFALTMISNATTGTPRGINTLRQLILNTCSKLAKMAGTSLKQFDDTPHTDDQNSSAVSKQATYKTSVIDKRRIKIDYWFPNSFDSDIPKNVGYDYLAPLKTSGGRPLTGLWTMNNTQFKKRVSAETLKYFDTTVFGDDKFAMQSPGGSFVVTPGDTPDTTGYTFFSPSIINLGQTNILDIPVVPIQPGSFSALVTAAGSLTMPSSTDLDKAANLDMNRSSWSVLDGGVSLDNSKVFSYIATKIMNYNLSGRLPYTNTVTAQRTKKVYSEPDSKIKFNLNEILSQKNCTAVLKHDTSANAATPAIAALIAAENYFGESSHVNATDSYESNTTPSDKELDPLDASYVGGAANYLFLALAYYFSGDCKIGSSAESAPRDFNVGFFTMSDAPGTVIPLLKAQVGGDLKAAGPRLSTLPNAIKSLLLSNQGNNRYNWSETSQDLTSNANYKATFSLNYQNIKKIEVLGGFEKNSDGEVLINAPKWVPLNKNIFDQNLNNSLFCRLVTYKSELFGVKMPSCLNLPVFHEYFIIDPTSAVVPIAPMLSPIPIAASAVSVTIGDMADYTSTGAGISELTHISVDQ